MMLSTGSMFRNSAPPGPPAGDPYFSSVVLLLGFEGTDGATTTSDQSPSAHSPITFNGNAQIDTAQAAVGSTSSCLFDGSGDYLSIPNSSDWRLSAANSDQFTIEFWIRPHDDGSTIERVMGQVNTHWVWYIDYNLQKPAFHWTSDDNTFQHVGAGAAPAISIDAWSFIAVSKNASGKIRLWRNGVLADRSTPANSAMFNSTVDPLEIGRSFGSAIYNGWLDEIRITKGICRYDTDGSIAVPTAPFPRS